MTTPQPRPFAQVDVFTTTPYAGNPVAVVLDAEGLDDVAMARFARWTNLSETTFVLPPRDPQADYRLRIFTPAAELPFAGHPTLGSAHAWLAAGHSPAQSGSIVQECGAGLVRLRRNGDRLAFAAPPLRRSGPLDHDTIERIAAGLRIPAGKFLAHQWVDNGPGWAGVLLAEGREVLDIEPDFDRLAGLCVGVAGYESDDSPTRLQVRAFAVAAGVPEDPVTGSLNAGLAQWLIGTHRMPPSYVADQGRRLGRDGHVHIDSIGDDIWVGGHCVTCIDGTVRV